MCNNYATVVPKQKKELKNILYLHGLHSTNLSMIPKRTKLDKDTKVSVSIFQQSTLVVTDE